MTEEKRQPEFLTIPKGTGVSRCSCGAPRYWVKHPVTRGPIPASVKWPGTYPPSNREDGRGINHFIDCPHRDRYRKKK